MLKTYLTGFLIDRSMSVQEQHFTKDELEPNRTLVIILSNAYYYYLVVFSAACSDA
jgi:hypothetical protein